MEAKVCPIEGCARKVEVKGFCSMHYKRIKRGSSNMAPEARGAILPKTHPFYVAWVNMKTRCNNPRSTQYPWYGARGIKVCERWALFKNFYEDMFPEWHAGLTFDRIDPNGNYEPANCRWVTISVQMKNRNKRGYLYASK